MTPKEQSVIQETADVIRHALDAIGCNPPIEMIDQDQAVRIGILTNNLTIRYEDRTWKVLEFRPHLQRIRTHPTMEGCVRDILMREPSLAFSQQEKARAVGE